MGKKKLLHLEMLKDVIKLVQTDFAFDMECKLLPKSADYTQREAKMMAEIISQIYSIAHCLTCEACQPKYYKN